MKALNLKGINWIMAMAMMCLVVLTGCSDDNEVETITPAFPELKEINVQANKTANISFNANMDWTLSSDASWCRFIDGEFEQTTMSGAAGSQTIQITVSEDGQDYENDAVAQITLRMGEQSQVIYKVTRAKKEYQALVVTDEEGNTYDETHPLTIKGNTATGEVYTSVKVEAEEGTVIGFGAYPDWLTVRNNEEEGTFDLTFNTENADYNFKYAISEDATVTFETESGERSITIPVIYEGMDATSLAVSPNYPNLQVRANGMLVTENGETAELSAEITARNDDYEIVEFIQNGESDYDFSANGDLDWITVTANEANVTFTVAANETGASRHAVVMAFPKAVYDEISGDLEGSIIETVTTEEDGETYTSTGIASKYSSFIISNLTQEAKTEQADVIEFIARFYAAEDGMGGYQINPLETTWGNVTFTKLSGSDAEQIMNANNMTSDANIYRATIPSTIMSVIAGQWATPLVFEATGMGSEQTIEGKETVTGVTGQAINGMTAVMENGEWIMAQVAGWGVSIPDTASMPANYAIVVRNADGTIAAYCEVVFTTPAMVN